MKVCLYSVAIGDAHIKWYRRYFARSHKLFAASRGWDYHVVTSLVSPTSTSQTQVSLQKLIAAESRPLSNYDLLVCIDTDVFARWRSGEELAGQLTPGKVHLVNEANQPSVTERITWARGWNLPETPEQYYAQCGYDSPRHAIYNGGVMIYSPRDTQTQLSEIFHLLESSARDHPLGLHFEQASLGHHLHERGLISELGHEWNRLWPLVNETTLPSNRYERWRLLNETVRSSVFTHFAAQTWRGIRPEIATGYLTW